MASITHEQCDALRRLNSNVVYILNDQASDKDGNPISYDLNAVNAEVAAKAYKYNRVTGDGTNAGYPDISDQLDKLWHDIDDGKLGADAKTGAWYNAVKTVKTNIPKP